MSFNRISAAEAASLIKHGYNIGLSGFTPAGTAKAVTAELAKIAEAEHAKGNPFQVGIFTGASTGESCDGVMSRAKAIRYRAPYTTNSDFRKAVNNGEIAYNDIHLSQMAQEVRYGFMGKVNVAIIEACEVTPDGKIYLTAAGGISPTICRLADQIIVELNAAHSKSCMGLHDVYEPLDPPYRREIPIYKPSDRIGLPYIQVDPKKIVGVVETNWPDEARSFAAADPLTDKIGQNVADFLAADMKRGNIPSTFLPLQSGVGNIANAVLGALGRDKTIPAFEMYTEVIQNSVIGLIREGRIKFGSACSLTVTNDCLEGIYNDMDFFRDKLVLRPSEILVQIKPDTFRLDNVIIRKKQIIEVKPEDIPNDIMITIIEHSPDFPGGLSGLREYLKKSIQYPKKAFRAGEEGQVTIEFTIDPKGNVINAQVVKSVSAKLDKEALRIIESMPQWKPGMQRGRPVAVRMSVPIDFVIDQVYKAID